MQILAVFLCALPLFPQDPELTPKLEGCRLIVQGKELAPRSAGAAELDPKPLALVGDVAWSVDPKAQAPEVLREDVARKLPLPKLTFDDAALGLQNSGSTSSKVTSLLHEGSALYLLRGDSPAGYAVARLEAASGKCVWARHFDSPPPEPGPGAVLLGPMSTAPAFASPRELQMFDGNLIVCARGASEVLRLDSVKGATVWSLERVWEFQRGYIGPSVWSHYLGRFGIQSFGEDSPETKAEFAERRKSFDALYSASVVAGPFLVDKPDMWGTRGRGFLVVVGLVPRDSFGEHLTQCFAYELSASGRPVSVVALPRAPLGWAAVAQGDRAVFACQQGAFACVSSSRNDGAIGMGMGSAPDATGRLAWYCEPAPARHPAWMRCDPAGDPVALDAQLGVRCASGGWIEKQGDKLFHFPLWLVDPREGTTREVELRVPFEGEMAAPGSNYRSDGQTIETWGARGLGITKLELAGDRLIVWLGNTKQAWQLEFDARELLPTK